MQNKQREGLGNSNDKTSPIRYAESNNAPYAPYGQPSPQPQQQNHTSPMRFAESSNSPYAPYGQPSPQQQQQNESSPMRFTESSNAPYAPYGTSSPDRVVMEVKPVHRQEYSTSPNIQGADIRALNFELHDIGDIILFGIEKMRFFSLYMCGKYKVKGKAEKETLFPLACINSKYTSLLFQTISASKQHIIWHFTINGILHKVELFDSVFTGRKRVKIDNQEVVDTGRVGFFGNEKFAVVPLTDGAPLNIKSCRPESRP